MLVDLDSVFDQPDLDCLQDDETPRYSHFVGAQPLSFPSSPPKPSFVPCLQHSSLFAPAQSQLSLLRALVLPFATSDPDICPSVPLRAAPSHSKCQSRLSNLNSSISNELSQIPISFFPTLSFLYSVYLSTFK